MAYLGKVWDEVINQWVSPRMASGGNGGGGSFKPMAAPNYIPPQAPQPQQATFPTFAPAPGQGVQPTAQPTVAGTLPFTPVNSTKDPRVLWEDGQIAIIFAGDFPANTGMGRSKSRKTLPDALTQQVDPGLTTAVGAGSRADLIKVFLAELLARPVGSQGAVVQAPPVGRLPNGPTTFSPPKIAKTGSFRGMVIPDFPHTCAACGGKMYQGMVQSVHDTADGRCPRETGGKKKKG